MAAKKSRVKTGAVKGRPRSLTTKSKAGRERRAEILRLLALFGHRGKSAALDTVGGIVGVHPDTIVRECERDSLFAANVDRSLVEFKTRCLGTLFTAAVDGQIETRTTTDPDGGVTVTKTQRPPDARLALEFLSRTAPRELANVHRVAVQPACPDTIPGLTPEAIESGRQSIRALIDREVRAVEARVIEVPVDGNGHDTEQPIEVEATVEEAPQTPADATQALVAAMKEVLRQSEPETTAQGDWARHRRLKNEFNRLREIVES